MIRKATLLALLTTTLLCSAAVVLPGTVNAQTTASRANPQIVLESTGPDVPREPTTQIKISGFLVNTGTQPWTACGSDALRVPAVRPAWRHRAYRTGQGLSPPPGATSATSMIAPSGKLPWEFVFTPQRWASPASASTR